MAFDEDWIAFLAAQSGISSIASARIYVDRFPQDPTLPAIATTRTDTERPVSFDGPTGRVRDEWAIQCRAKTRGACRQLAEAVIAACHGYRGAMGSTTVHACLLLTEQDAYDGDLDEAVSELSFRVSYSP